MKVALGQINPTIGDFEGNRRLVLDATAAAEQQGAELAIFPELALAGYPPRDLLERTAFLDSLISDDPAEHERFYAAVNAPFVGDAATRWVDGQKALSRPELGLSNWQAGRLFGRGGVLSGDGVYSVRTRARKND